MQYLVSVIFDKAGLATPDEDAAIGVFNDRLVAEGHWVFAGGLGAPSTATVIDNRGEEAMFTDGDGAQVNRFCREFCDAGYAGCKMTRLRSRSKLARPYIWRLIILIYC